MGGEAADFRLPMSCKQNPDESVKRPVFEVLPQVDQAGAMHAIRCVAGAGNRKSLARDCFRRPRLNPPGDEQDSLALRGENAAPR
jgi:hypothetical protein